MTTSRLTLSSLAAIRRKKAKGTPLSQIAKQHPSPLSSESLGIITRRGSVSLR